MYQCDSSIIQLLSVTDSEYLLVSTDSLLFYQLTVDNKRTNEKIRIKLAGKKEYFKILLIDEETIGICYGEREIRIWDLSTNDNALFRLQNDKGYSEKDFIICLSFSPRKSNFLEFILKITDFNSIFLDMISAGTAEGRIARWKRRRDMKDQPLDQQWRLQSALETDCRVCFIGYFKDYLVLVSLKLSCRNYR